MRKAAAPFDSDEAAGTGRAITPACASVSAQSAAVYGSGRHRDQERPERNITPPFRGCAAHPWQRNVDRSAPSIEDQRPFPRLA